MAKVSITCPEICAEICSQIASVRDLLKIIFNTCNNNKRCFNFKSRKKAKSDFELPPAVINIIKL
jgi:hypothetical protein